MLLLGTDPPATEHVGLTLLEERSLLHHPDVVGRLRRVPRGVVLLELGHEALAEDVHAVLVVVGAPEGRDGGDLLGVALLQLFAGLVAPPERLYRQCEINAELAEAVELHGLQAVAVHVATPEGLEESGGALAVVAVGGHLSSGVGAGEEEDVGGRERVPLSGGEVPFKFTRKKFFSFF